MRIQTLLLQHGSHLLCHVRAYLRRHAVLYLVHDRLFHLVGGSLIGRFAISFVSNDFPWQGRSKAPSATTATAHASHASATSVLVKDIGLSQLAPAQLRSHWQTVDFWQYLAPPAQTILLFLHSFWSQWYPL